MDNATIPTFRAPSVPVSAVIPCFRCAQTIERALASVARQSAVPEAVILIDDLSGDGTLDQLYRLQQQYPAGWITVIAKPANDVPGSARNAGWEAATTPYIAFLDADDSWHPHKIALQYRLMAGDPTLALSGHRGGQKDVPDSLAEESATPLPAALAARRVSRGRLLLFNEFITRSVMLRRDLPQRFEPKKKYCEDYLLWMQIVFAGHRASVLEHTLAYAYKADAGEGGLSQNVWSMEKGELDTYRRIFREQRIGLYRAIPIYAFSLVKFTRRTLLSRWRRWTKGWTGLNQPAPL